MVRRGKPTANASFVQIARFRQACEGRGYHEFRDQVARRRRDYFSGKKIKP